MTSESDEQAALEPLHPQRLTWAALLGRWIDFARSALALPDDEQGRRLRQCVPDIIMLQAVWCALREIEDLERPQQALGVDRAGVLIDKHAAAIETAWAGEPLPPMLVELIEDARAQWAGKAEEVDKAREGKGL